MTVNRKIIDALAFLKIPVAESFYDGKEEEYITFETPIDSGADFGDDEPGKIIVQVRVHWWIPIKKNYLAVKKKIRNALHDAGFTFPYVRILPDPDTLIRHVLFECEIEEESK